MENNELEFEFAVVIVNFGVGSKLLKLASRHGIHDATVLLGMGTARNRILEFLELTDIRKEIVLLAAEKTAVHTVLEVIDSELELRKPNHGIAFTLPLPVFFEDGKGDYIYKPRKEASNIMYNSVISIVDKGKAELVMQAATEAGARGGTIIKARGSAGMYETTKVFNMDIEPEKEMVLILTEALSMEKISTAIRDRLNMDDGGKCIIFCQEVTRTFGMS